MSDLRFDEVPSLGSMEDIVLDDVTEASRAVRNARQEVKVIPGVGVVVDGKLLSLELEEWKGTVKLSKLTKRLQQRKRKLSTVKKRKVGRPRVHYKTRQSKHRKAMKAWKAREDNRERRSKAYRVMISSDPRGTFEMLKSKSTGEWDMRYEEWLEYFWPVYSSQFVLLRRWLPDKPYSLENCYLQLVPEDYSGKGRLSKKFSGPRPPGLVFDGMEVRMRELGMS